MKVMIIFQVVIAIADIVAAKAFLRQGIFGLFFTVLIFGAFYKLSYHCILIYTFLSIFFSVIFLVYILTMYYPYYIDSNEDQPQMPLTPIGLNTTSQSLALVLSTIFSIPFSTFTPTENLSRLNTQKIPFLAR